MFRRTDANRPEADIQPDRNYLPVCAVQCEQLWPVPGSRGSFAATIGHARGRKAVMAASWQVESRTHAAVQGNLVR